MRRLTVWLMGTVFGLAAAGQASAMSLTDAVRLAVDSNPEIGQAIEDRAATGFELQQALGLYSPRVDLEASTGGEILSNPSRRAAGIDKNLLLPSEMEAFGLAALSGIPVESLKAPPGNGLGAWDFIRVGLLVPALETLVLAGMLLFLPERWSIVSRATVMGVAWGGLHALLAPMWFFGPAFLFFVCSRAYLTWRPVSFRHAFTAAGLPHALNNLAVMTWAAING